MFTLSILFSLVLAPYAASDDRPPAPPCYFRGFVGLHGVPASRFLLGDGSVQDELKCSGSQRARLRQVIRDYMTESAYRRARLEREGMLQIEKGCSESERRSTVDRWRQQQIVAAANCDSQVLGILTVWQVTRLDEIRVQLAGAGAFRSPEICERLRLSESERTRIELILGREMDRASRLRDILLVLSEGQSRSYYSMAGQPIHFMRPSKWQLRVSSRQE
jgi:hypothetical protein